MYVIENAEGRFMAQAEPITRVGAQGDLRPLPVEWTELDHAIRFPTAEAAQRAAPSGSRVLSLREAWAEEEQTFEEWAAAQPEGWESP